MRDRIIFAVKLSLSIFIVFLIGRRMDMQQLALTVQHADLRYLGLVAAALLYFLTTSTGLGLVRWHPSAKPMFLPWPQPMALDNHWVLVGEA